MLTKETTLINEALIDPLNRQIGNEFGASMQYLAIAVYFDGEGLPDLAGHFYSQADEERKHAMKIVRFLLDSGAKPRIPATKAPKVEFSSAQEAVNFSLNQEMEVTNDINSLVSLALQNFDHTTDTFLRWFVTEQVEEVSSMTNLLQIIKHAGPNLLLVEEYVRRRAAGASEQGAG